VTIVFCDLVGFTGRAEVMDPEDVGDLLSSYHQHLRSELERHGATVEKFIGDAVVAVFGAPAVHEDDPERAVRAAIAIRDWAREQPDIEVRVAVNTGEALVSLDIDPGSGEGMVAGDVINTAARIQVAAPVNGILVGEQTYRATRDAIAYVERESFDARGKSSPVAIWEVVAPRGRVREGIVPRSPFVGRERELALLRDAYSRMRDDGQPQLVTLIAVPGAGKSRLVYELSRFVDSDPDLVCWRQGQCLPYGEGVSFWALAEIVKAEMGILDSDAPGIAATKLAESVRALVPAEDVEWIERDLRPLIGLAESGRRDAVRTEDAFPAWQRFLEALAERGPCVLVIEDLHWADDGLLDFLDQFTTACAGLPVLLVATSRPELITRRPQWGGGKTNAATVSLSPLSDTDTAQIVHTLLARPALPAHLQRQLIERSGGNPLYAEEFARILAEHGDDETAIPETVQGIIAARLDGLAPENKRLLQDAAVVGSTFWVGAVATLGTLDLAAVEATLRQLEQREFVRRERRSSVEGEAEYAFRHVLVRDAAYSQIPRGERSERHARAAEWTAALGRPDDHAELVAHHYLEALRYAEAAKRDVSQLAGPARVALRDAGERAERLAAYAQAARYFGSALELTPDGVERGELLYLCGNARHSADSTGIELLVQAVTLLRDCGRREMAARAALVLAKTAWEHVDRAGFENWLGQIEELTADDPDSIAWLEALVARSGFYMVGGQYQRAIDDATEALRHLEGVDRPDLIARSLDVRGTSRAALGDPLGLDDSRRAIDVGLAGRAVAIVHHAVNNMITGLTQLGRTRDVPPLLERWGTLFDEIGGAHFSRLWFLIAQAEYAYQVGEWETVSTRLDEFSTSIPQGQPHYLQPASLILQAMMHLARGQDASAVRNADQALEIARREQDPQALVPILCVHARLCANTGRREAAAADWAALVAIKDVVPDSMTQDGVVHFAFVASELDKRDEAGEIIDRCPAEAWVAVARAIIAEDFATAADLLDEMGRKTEAADVRLHAGPDHVRLALQFYKSVGAVRYIEQALAYLETTA